MTVVHVACAPIDVAIESARGGAVIDKQIPIADGADSAM
jgi:hypothetical protein